MWSKSHTCSSDWVLEAVYWPPYGIVVGKGEGIFGRSLTVAGGTEEETERGN